MVVLANDRGRCLLYLSFWYRSECRDVSIARLVMSVGIAHLYENALLPLIGQICVEHAKRFKLNSFLDDYGSNCFPNFSDRQSLLVFNWLCELSR